MTAKNANNLMATILAGGKLPEVPSRVDLQTPLLAAALARLSNRMPLLPVPAQ
jgi:hypothetical protein